MKNVLTGLTTLAMIGLGLNPAQADQNHNPTTNVLFEDCTEFVGIAPVDGTKARSLLPSRYTLVTDTEGAKLVVRIANCQSIRVNQHHPQPGTVAHIGLMVYSPDGTATDPNTSINNYTLSFTSNVAELVKSLRQADIAASFDANLAYEFSPATGPSELYAAVTPDNPASTSWFVHGTVTNPLIPSPFLANWWASTHKGQVKMATDIPLIYFDFTSNVRFFTSRQNPIGDLIGSNQIASFPLSFRGQFASATMLVSRNQ